MQSPHTTNPLIGEQLFSNSKCGAMVDCQAGIPSPCSGATDMGTGARSGGCAQSGSCEHMTKTVQSEPSPGMWFPDTYRMSLPPSRDERRA